jgi:hypothetical protein
MVPRYTDVSHFRSPYKNSWPYTGTGGFGDDVPVGPNGSGPPPGYIEPGQALLQFVLIDEQGRVIYQDTVAEVLLKNLEQARAVFLSDRAVSLIPFTPEEAAVAAADSGAKSILLAASAAAWVKRKLKEGNVIFATPGLVLPGSGDRQLAAVPKGEKETVLMTSHIAPILAEPSLLSMLGTPVGIAVAALGVGGLLYVVLRKKPRGRVATGSF